MNFSIFFTSTSNTLGVTPAHLTAIAQATTIQANRDWGRYFGGTHNIRVAASATDVQPGEVQILIADTLPGAPPGAIADHDVTTRAAPVINVALSMVNSVLTGQNSLSVAISHEILETLGDPAINRRVYKSDGTGVALERCDACESNYYPLNLSDPTGPALATIRVDVSDFLLDAFFAEDASAPYTFIEASASTLPGSIIAGVPSAPFVTANGGYQVAYDVDGNATQVAAGDQRLTIAKRTHSSSRTYRRGLRS